MISNKYKTFNLPYITITIICVQLTSSTYTVDRNEKDFLTVDVPMCGQYNALGSVQDGKLGCKCGNGRGIESKFHALLKDQTPYCFSSFDLGR